MFIASFSNVFDGEWIAREKKVSIKKAHKLIKDNFFTFKYIIFPLSMKSIIVDDKENVLRIVQYLKMVKNSTRLGRKLRISLTRSRSSEGM